MSTRTDARYVDSTDDRAILRAWLGEGLDMGGWTDDDADAFRAAVTDEASQQLREGEALTAGISIERIHDGCAYCGEMIERPTSREVPAADDDAAWARLTPLHMAGCEWIETRAHRRDV